MSVDLSKIYGILKDRTRSRILETLEKRGPLTYGGIQDQCGIAHTGTLNYHLKVLSDLVRKDDETGLYELTEKGKIATELLHKFAPACPTPILGVNGTGLSLAVLVRSPRTWRFIGILLTAGLGLVILGQVAYFAKYGEALVIFGFSFSPEISFQMWSEVAILLLSAYLAFRSIPSKPPTKTIIFILLSFGLYLGLLGVFPIIVWLQHPFYVIQEYSGSGPTGSLTVPYTLLDAIQASDTYLVISSIPFFALAAYLLVRKPLNGAPEGSFSIPSPPSPGTRQLPKARASKQSSPVR